jgi:protein O-mannosyl-transferase
LALLFFVLALLSKPMPVTLPVVMLLLDYWPLKRVEGHRLKVAGPAGGELSTFKFEFSIIWEKWPFFLLAAASCVVTFLAQRNTAVSSLTQVPFGYRLENSLTAYAGYLWKTIWPLDLGIFYPLRAPIAWQLIAESAIVLTGISVIVWLERRVSPWLIVGWLWFLVTLLPVIGLVQVGAQSMADRYSYFPLIGIFLAIAFSAQTLAVRFSFLKTWLAVAAILMLGSCLVLTERQLRYWHDSESLFTHALEVDQSDTAHICLGIALEGQNRPSEALTHFLMAWRLLPKSDLIHANIAQALDDEGKPDLAALNYREAVKRRPQSSATRINYGIVLQKLGRLDEALEQFSIAARLDASSSPPQFLMGKCLLQLGRDAEAMTHFNAGLQLDPDNLEMLLLMANVQAADQNPEARDGRDAQALAGRLVKLTGGQQPAALDALAMAKAELGQFDEAIQIQQQAVKLIEATGPKEDVAAMQNRLELYQKHQPWRESFNQTLKISLPEKLSPQ